MQRHQKILVCIHNPETDIHVLQYMGPMSRIAQTTEIHLLHVRWEQAPAGTPISPPNISADDLRDMADRYFKGTGEEKITTQVVKGSPLVEILRYAVAKDVDLIAMGRRPVETADLTQSAMLSRRVARKSACSVLVLPCAAPREIKRIMVPLRDSECSANAMEVACTLADGLDAELISLNVFPLPPGYERLVGKSLDENTQNLYQRAELECQNVISRVETYGRPVRTVLVPEQLNQSVPIIIEHFEQAGADLLVIGARGRTGMAGVLLGTTTEGLIQQSRIPVFAVKKKGECIGVLQAMLSVM